MLSEKIRALADGLGPYLHSGLHMEPEGVATVLAVLNDCRAQAEHLERTAVPLPARLTARDLGPNVLRFQRRGQ